MTLAEAYEAALAAEKEGAEAARAAWARVLAMDPADPGGAAVRLAAWGGPAPDRASPAYIATLFDQHADVFETTLVDQLGYAVPMQIRERLDALGLGPFERMLDLGCGTGLCALSLEDRAAHRTGVDLSEAMIEIAGEDDLYHDLYIADVVSFLERTKAPPWDLATVADTLPYIGDAAPLFTALHKRMAKGGTLALSSETLGDEEMAEAPWRVTKNHRFAHSRAYLEGALKAAGFETLETTPITVRTETGAPIPGWLILARA